MRPIVLIAETDELLAAAYRAFLVAEGFDVDWVTNGLDCLAHIREQTPLALILDAELPWGSGEGVLEMMAQDSDLPHIPAVLLTARPDILARHRVGSTPPVTLIKPVSPVAIARTLHEVLALDSLAVRAPSRR